MPLGTLALQGWKHNQQIVAARDRTRADPEARGTVRLLDHVIKTTQHPEVIVDVNGIPTTLLELTLVVRMKVSTADLVIERGEITKATPGSSTAEATLLAGTVVLAKKEFDKADVTPP